MCRNRYRIVYDFLLILCEADNVVPSLLLKRVFKKILRFSGPRNSLSIHHEKKRFYDWLLKEFPLPGKGEVGN